MLTLLIVITRYYHQPETVYLDKVPDLISFLPDIISIVLIPHKTDDESCNISRVSSDKIVHDIHIYF